MLTRIYVDNFRCLVNFELKLDRLNLLLGENGSGKSSVFEMIGKLQRLLGEGQKVHDLFLPEDLTRWQQLAVQRIELEVNVAGASYAYSLSVRHDRDSDTRVVDHECLRMDERILYEFSEGRAKIYVEEDDADSASLPVSREISGISIFLGHPQCRLLTKFCSHLGKVVVVKPLAPGMNSESGGDERRLAHGATNFASWYRYLSQVHQGNVFDLTQELREALPGFDSFSFREAGERTKILKVLMRNAKDAKTIPYNFDELSDGQRQLILLYTLLYGVKGEGYCLFLDEPDNFVALREIQPWLTALHDACGNEISQAVLISHNPEVVDYLASSKGKWFERPDNGPVRVRDMPPPTDGLTVSETIARGWVE